MALRCGIVGLPNVGKSVIFNALTSAGADTASFPFSTVTPNVGSIPVPDARLERIHARIETEKVVPAELQVVDIAGLPKGASRGEGLGNKFLGHIKECDALLHVVRFFRNKDLGDEYARIDPLGDIDVVEMELALADLETVERNLDRVAKKAKSGDKEMVEQRDLFTRVREALLYGRQVRSLGLTERELRLVKPLFLLTAKQVLYVANVADYALDDEDRAALAELEREAEARGSEVVALAGRFEADLCELGDEDRAVFLEDAGLTEPGLVRLIQKAYHLLGLRTFFTAGPKEIRAWTFHDGDKAPVAAGVIHSDFEAKFIRAQIHSIEDLEAHGTEHGVKEAGKLRIEGKEYLMRDGDVVHFLIGN
ncbi:MAG: redox-regulated ATPase YchF [Planctomycetota bacterium]